MDAKGTWPEGYGRFAGLVMDISAGLSLVACIAHILAWHWMPALTMGLWAVFVALSPGGAFHERFFYGAGGAGTEDGS